MADKQKAKTEEEIKGILAHEIRSAILYDKEELSESRSKAINYFLGDLKDDVPAPPNRSSVVSKDTSDVIGWMLPGIMRTFMASGRVVECEPVGPEDEAYSDQASDYLHHVFMNENDGYRIMYEATHDSLLLKNGIVKVWWDDTEETEETEHSGVDLEQLTMLTNEPGVEVLAATENEMPAATVDEQGQPVEVALYDVKLQRIKSTGKLCFDVIEPENFGMNREAKTIEESRFTYHREEKTRSSLIEMGFDREKVEAIPGDRDGQWAEEELARDESASQVDDSKDRSTEIIEVYECYLQTDADGDGVAETVRAVYAGGYSDGELLDWEICEDSAPFVDIPCQPVPHRWDAISMADETMDMAKIKTVLTRQMLDNVYQHNNPQPEVEEGSVINTNSLTNAKFGQPIIRKKGSLPIAWNNIPFIADKTLVAVEHINDVIERRTGVSRSTMALDPDALQNQTATAVQKTQDAAYSKIELIARNQAELGWKRVFKKALKLIVKHQDRQKTIRLTNGWVNVDPRSWNAEMDITINIGLGTGSRDRDMAMLNSVLQNQIGLADRFTASGMTQQALQLLPKIRQTMVRIGEAAGLRNADDYYPEYNSGELMKVAQQAAQEKPDPKVELEKQRLQMDMESKKATMQMDAQKMAQEGEFKRQQAGTDIQLAREKANADIQTKRAQIDAEMALKREQLSAELELKREQLSAELMLKRELGIHSANVSASTSEVRPGGDPG